MHHTGQPGLGPHWTTLAHTLCWGLQIAAKVSESAYDVRLLVNWDQLVFPAAVMLADLTDDDRYHHVLQSNYLAQWLCTQSGTVAFTNKVRSPDIAWCLLMMGNLALDFCSAAVLGTVPTCAA